jgi:hypothetical protein
MKKFFSVLIIFIISLMITYCEATDTTISNVVFNKIKNSWESVQSGDDIVIDDETSGPFYGVFQIKFDLDPNQYYGNIKVEVYVQKTGDSWKKIADVTPPAKPASGAWTTTFYWNSRDASNGYTAPFKTNLKIKFKVVEQ